MLRNILLPRTTQTSDGQQKGRCIGRLEPFLIQMQGSGDDLDLLAPFLLSQAFNLLYQLLVQDLDAHPNRLLTDPFTSPLSTWMLALVYHRKEQRSNTNFFRLHPFLPVHHLPSVFIFVQPAQPTRLRVRHRAQVVLLACSRQPHCR